MPEPASRLTEATAANLVAAIRDHENFVLRRRGGKRADLRFWRLKGIKLRERRLDEIELSGADLSGADLGGTNLDRASLNCANLSGADLTKSSVRRADLRGARIQGAKFDYADLQGADFRQATIAYMDRHNHWMVVGGRQDVTTVSFAHCSLKGARLDNANLKDANFDGAILSGASFAGATLGDATFEGAVLLGVRTQELRVPKERLKNCIVEPGPALLEALPQLVARLEQSEIWVTSGGRRGCIANCDGEDIRVLSSLMKSRKLTGVELPRTIAVGIDVSGCELQRANFDGADLRDVRFVGADLRGASFRGANLAHADFSGANMEALILNDGTRIATSFAGAITDGAKFDAAH